LFNKLGVAVIRYKVYIAVMVIAAIGFLALAVALFCWSYALLGSVCALFVLFPIFFIYRAKQLNALAAAQGISPSLISYSRLTIGRQSYEED
jgi:predicted membrane metal-binding protein